DAALAGEIDFGLVNHYYLWRALQENPSAPGANHFLPEGEASSFVNLAGVGTLSGRAEAVELVRFLLSEEAQSYFARETFEYPVVPAVEAAGELAPLADLRTPEVDFGEVAAVLEPTLEQIRRSGLLP
ncbi:MAG TPA: iron ABC transporter substrate-binding protein, partial [Thermoanaerobaculia bacterium]|nr:iron ABC transporter substrate-binding protein [Thermoanaerobaculia bacterium]